jgi:hypothetical protein
MSRDERAIAFAAKDRKELKEKKPHPCISVLIRSAILAFFRG